jgi:SagB-type dehydrogenase family enzyme
MEPDPRWQLSRFAYLHREGDTMVLASARSGERMLLPAPETVAVVASLTVPRTMGEIADAIDNIGLGEVQALVQTLATMGLIAPVDLQGQLGEAIDSTLQQWEFHDRLLHGRTQRGRDSSVAIQADRVDAPLSAPACPAEPTELVSLPKPVLPLAEPPFTAVLESRRSTRRFGDPPLTLSQLGEFLFRIARDPRIAERRLGLYVTVDRCLDLPEGIYRYLPVEHGLLRRGDRAADVAALIRQAMRAAELERPPQALLTLTATADRLASPAIGYAGVLLDAGAMYQTMYLTATAMGLGACGLGTSDEALFARAAGVDALAEPSVGEFVLGTLPAPDVPLTGAPHGAGGSPP